MRIAFYAPLKSPTYAVPSGDRLMGRLLMQALRLAGHDVTIASELRAFLPQADEAALAGLKQQAETERRRIAQAWWLETPPDLWLCYHPYYKAPDFLGPGLAEEFGLAYVTAEASHSTRRGIGLYAETQAAVWHCVATASCNICFTQRDRTGLAAVLPHARYEMLAPFIDVADLAPGDPQPGRLIAIAMMRKGDKFESYEMLAKALAELSDMSWALTVIGDGPLRQQTQALFAGMPPERIIWRGELAPQEIARQLQQASLYVWPGCGEAYGLAYLEAQAAGLPVVAQATGGVPEVVRPGPTGLLTPAGEVAAYAAAIRLLLENAQLRRQMAAAARDFVLHERDLPQAAQHLHEIIVSCRPQR
jgi:glycosyltransferase involved in cell wall biosynthesis